MSAFLQEEDVGAILIRVQEDLVRLKEKFDTENVDVSQLRAALNSTESGLRVRAEELLTQMNNRVTSFPTLEEQLSPDQVSAEGRLQSFSRQPTQSQGVESRGLDRQFTGQQMGPEFVQTIPLSQLISPGEKYKREVALKILQNPQNELTRKVAQQTYGIQLPLIHAKKPTKVQADRVVRGSNVEKLARLPRENRVNPQLAPPAITEEDARKGLLSLVERGLIPPTADIAMDPPPIRNRLVYIHDENPDRGALRFPADTSEPGFNLSGYHLDHTSGSHDRNGGPRPMIGQIGQETSTQRTRAQYESPGAPPASQRSDVGRRGSGTGRHAVALRTFDVPLQPMALETETTQTSSFIAKSGPTVPPPTTPASRISKSDASHRFAIQNGKTRINSSDFLNFKQHYCLAWGAIVTCLSHMEKFLQKYSIPIAFVHGDMLADLSVEYELEAKPSEYELFQCLVNRDDIQQLINKPGRQFIGPDGMDRAATKIQSEWRRFQARKYYIEFRRKKWAAGVIAIRWVLHVKMSSMKKQLKIVRMKHLENFQRRSYNLTKNWKRMQSSRRVIIHIPSMGFTQKIRDGLEDFALIQNTQMSRLCDVKDANVDVIYVAPVPINDEVLQYYSKLIGLKPAIESGKVEDQKPMSDRYKIIVPEAIKSFPSHNMCLASLLKYSPRALKRIKNMIRGRKAYIVPGTPHMDDLAVADYLDCPVLCPEPELAHLYSTKSGSKRVFTSAKVPIPPSEYDVYSLDQLHEVLAQLITENLSVHRWLLKLDSEFGGRGIAYLDLAKHLKCYEWALKQRQSYGEKWNKKWAQEATYMRILDEIPSALAAYATPANKDAYSSWDKYIGAFLSQGGVVEACPPSDSITNLTVDMLIEPDGTISIVSSGDQIHDDNPLSSWGLSVPQSSVEPTDLNNYCMRIGEACRQRKIIGYFSIDFVTFIDPETSQQDVWATDLGISYSDSTGLTQLALFATNGTFTPSEHTIVVPPKVKEEPKRVRIARKVEEPKTEVLTRYIAMSAKMMHTNLTVVHYSVFFQMCRAHGIGFDIREKQGTIYSLVDSFNRKNICMITVNETLEGALAAFGRNLYVIHQEISSPNMQGESNFRPVIKEIEEIIGQAIENADLPQEPAIPT